MYIREPIPGGPSYWTGPGYMRVMEGDSIEFTVTDISFPTYYDIVLRYDPRVRSSPFVDEKCLSCFKKWVLMSVAYMRGLYIVFRVFL